jgi:signal transduction histidine kinase
MKLSKFILSDMEAVLQQWDEFAAIIPSARGLTRTELRDHAREILSTIAADMQTAQSGAEQVAKSRGQTDRPDSTDTPAEDHGSGRFEAGFDLDQMVSEFRALRATVTRLWERQLSPSESPSLEELTRFHEGIDQALAESIARFSQDLQRTRELMLASLVHDVRSPLAAMIQSGTVLLRSSELTTDQKRIAGIVVSSGSRISGMVTNLLDVAHARFGGVLPVSCAPMDVAGACRQVAAEIQAAHPGIAVELEISGDTTGIWDSQRLQQLLSNLLENAITYGDTTRPIRVIANGSRPELVLCVHNHGTPIPADKLHRIFDPLERVATDATESRQPGSLGLGLFIVREIARAHGGAVFVRSSADQGTLLETRLPRRSTQPGTAKPAR